MVVAQGVVVVVLPVAGDGVLLGRQRLGGGGAVLPQVLGDAAEKLHQRRRTVVKADKHEARPGL
jgi:hypothetical protein